MHSWKILFTAGALLALASPALAEEPADLEAYVRSHQDTISLLPKKGLSIAPAVTASFDGSDFGLGSTDTREFSGGALLRYGLSRNTEVTAQVQIGRIEAKSEFLGARVSETFDTGLAEIGVRQLLFNYDDARPEVVASATFGHPFGDLPGTEPYFRGGLEAYQLVDPVLLSGEVGVRVGVRTGVTHFDVQGTATFLVNDRLSLLTGVSWTDGGEDFGRPLETGVSVRGGVTLASPAGDSHLSAYVSVGATEAAPDAVLGIAWTRRW